MRRYQVMTVLAGVLVVGGSLASAEEVRISGTVVSVDARAGALVLEELTASASPQVVVAQRSVMLGPDTAVELVQRAGQSPDGWLQGYVALPLSREELKPGDFVSVTGERRDGGLQGRAISVVRPDGMP